MIEQWFRQDIESHLDRAKRVVVCDAKGEGAFLLPILKQEITVLTAGNHLDELTCRYKAEKYYAESPVVFYSMMPKQEISFLLEYAQIDGLVDLTNIEQYIQKHLFTASGINATISKAELILAAKLGIGKDLNWWKGVATGIIKPFDINESLQTFVCAPDEYAATLDTSVRKLFVEQLYKMIAKPQVKQTNVMMAQETMNAIFDGLAMNNLSKELLNIYYTLTDKSSARKIMDEYLSVYTLPSNISPLAAHEDHPFEELDREVTILLSKAIENDTDISAALHYINKRISSKYAQSYKAHWLKDLSALFEYDATAFNKVSSLSDFVEQYKLVFAKVDNAMRKIYVAWLNKPDILRPIQYYYEQLAKPMFDRWYSLVKEYKPSQKNLVVEALQQKGRVAVIVGDGLRLEIALEMADELKKIKEIDFDDKTAFALLPSVTENGMSALYGCNNMEISAQTRFNTLKAQIPETTIMALDSLNEYVTAEKLVLTFGDIDQVGEKKQLAGLKDISNYTPQVCGVIKQLLAMGYGKVYVTADHGFVITGLLDEADKVPVPSAVDIKVGERFILSNDKIGGQHLIERMDKFGNYVYQYYAETDKPFVSRGAYGYAHGGLSPQECIIPMFCFSKEVTQDGCNVYISNKSDLQAVTGSYFTIKIVAEGDPSLLFSSERKIKLQLFDAKEIGRASCWESV